MLEMHMNALNNVKYINKSIGWYIVLENLSNDRICIF